MVPTVLNYCFGDLYAKTFVRLKKAAILVEIQCRNNCYRNQISLLAKGEMNEKNKKVSENLWKLQLM